MNVAYIFLGGTRRYTVVQHRIPDPTLDRAASGLL